MNYELSNHVHLLNTSLPFWTHLHKSNRTFSYKLRSFCWFLLGRLWNLAVWRHFQFVKNRPHQSGSAGGMGSELARAQSWHAHEGISKLQSSGPMPISSVNLDHSPSVPTAPPQWNPITALKALLLCHPEERERHFKTIPLTLAWSWILMPAH